MNPIFTHLVEPFFQSFITGSGGMLGVFTTTYIIINNIKFTVWEITKSGKVSPKVFTFGDQDGMNKQ